MAYSREEEFKIKADMILKKYERFFDEVYGVMLELNGYVESLSKTPSQEFFDFARFISTDEDIQKIISLYEDETKNLNCDTEKRLTMIEKKIKESKNV